ncbi:MAG: DUF1552 domain-containing protein [Acidobacteriia bacterium]|nr:DUF1552 domain-containing protein [Terriglobia bacterium]
MRIVTKKHLSRRTLLRGMGVSLALPLLDSMIPALTAQSKTAAKPLQRLGFVYIPHGAVMDKWTPAQKGSGFEFGPVLQPLEPFRDRVVVVSGLAHHQADSLGDGGADHARSSPCFLSAVHPKRTEGEDVRAGVTIDQIAAQKIGQETQFPSLEVATEDMTGLVGACDTGYSCAYMNTISWRTPTTPNPMEINPRVVFERLFGEGGSAAEQMARLEEDRSVLDTITREAKHLQVGLPARDRTRVSEYMENVREIERRIQKASKQAGGSGIEVPEAPVGIPDSWDEHAKLMFDLLALSYQADITRVFTFMLARELSQRTYPQVGVPDPHHATSHHQDNPEKLAKLVKIQNYHVSMLAHFLEKLRATPDGDGNLLDHTLLLYGSSMSNSNIHNHSPLPVLLAGGGAGALQGGRHLKYPEGTPMANMLLTVMNKAGVSQEKVGDSTGPLAEL